MIEGKPEKQPVSAIKGTHDILPREARAWQLAEAAAKSTFELYGYREIRAPVFEATELFEKGTGQTSDIVQKEMYTFTDKGGRSITLRPEYTPSVVRAIIEHRLDLKPDPMRYYFIGPMFRFDKPQKGRFRQFHQVDIEVFGENDPAIDAEIVEMADHLLKKLGVSEMETLINSVAARRGGGRRAVALSRLPEESVDQPAADLRLQGRVLPGAGRPFPRDHEISLPRMRRAFREVSLLPRPLPNPLQRRASPCPGH
jgi:histidyl-tRNA synthetase